MKREFSEEKKEELYAILDAIDVCALPPFLQWCGSGAYEFGDWADRLGIVALMQPAQDCQDAVRELNDSARRQIDAAFENVAEADRQYAQAIKKHAEDVEGQIAIANQLVRAINPDAVPFSDRAGLTPKEGAALQSYLRTEGLAAFPMDRFTGSPQEQQAALRALIRQNRIRINGETVEKAQIILARYLQMKGITDPARQQKIYRMALDTHPMLLVQLCAADNGSFGDAGAAAAAILQHYAQNRVSWQQEFTKQLLQDCLAAKGYENPVEREFIADMIQAGQSQELRQLCRAYFRNPDACDAMAEKLVQYYEIHRQDISLEAIAEALQKDENAGQPSRVCSYYEYLWKLDYICHAEYERFLKGMDGKGSIDGKGQEELRQFMAGRQELMDALKDPRPMGNNGEDAGWSREQIMCALQIQTIFSEVETPKFDQEFIAGLIGHMKAEGDFGLMEKTNKDGGNKYRKHINDCIGYHERYSGKKIEEIDLVQLYVDMVWKREEGGCQDDTKHKFGIGAIQWTAPPFRPDGLLDKYLQEAGFEGAGDDRFQDLVQKYHNGEPYEAVLLDQNQIREAEMEMMLYELTSQEEANQYKNFYSTDYQEECKKEGIQEGVPKVIKASQVLGTGYIGYGTETGDQRENAALRWYEAWGARGGSFEADEEVEGNE